LLIEDDPSIAEIIGFFIKNEPKYSLHWCATAKDALAVAKEGFDVILLDIMLPDIEGLSLCVELRRELYCPIIFISSLDDENTIVKALQLGGDDYLVKPFKCPVLLAKIDAHLRRMAAPAPAAPEPCRTLRLDANTHTVEKNGEKIYLSPTEYELMAFFMSHPGRIVELEELYQAVWRKPSFGDVRTVPVHVGNLRKKIEDNYKEPRFIKTVKRIGYVFED